MKEIVIHGRGGQGAVMAAQALASAAVYEGKYATAFPHFGAERRGAPVRGFARISDTPIHRKSQVYNPDYVIVLDPRLAGLVDIARGMEPHIPEEISPSHILEGHMAKMRDVCEGLGEEGTIVLNTSHNPEDVELSIKVRTGVVDATSIALRILGHPVTNSSMLGAFSKVTDEVSLEAIEHGITDIFGSRLGEDLAERNIKAADEGYDSAKIGVCKGGKVYEAEKKWLPDVNELPLGCIVGSEETEVGKIGPGSYVENKTGTWRTFRPVLDEEKCTYCQLCWFHCPEGCIRRVPERKVVKIDYTYCKGCGICSEVCPVDAIHLVKEEE